MAEEKRIAPTLSNAHRDEALRILHWAQQEIQRVADGDDDVLYNVNKFVYKRLHLDERGPIGERRKFRQFLWDRQGGRCVSCQEAFTEADLLDKHRTTGGRYINENTVLAHRQCHADYHRREGTERETS